MKWSVALRLGRVSNLPTVTSNVLAGVALGGGHPRALHLATICIALSLMYVAGMYLNDAFDRDIDRRERPDRPIPAGEVSALTVFEIGFALLGSGVLLIALLVLTTGTTWWPIAAAAALACVIVFYDAYHKGNPWSPVLMGLCRAGVYVTAALAVTAELRGDVLVGAGAMIAYLIGLTYIAKQENLAAFSSWWPVAFLAVPFVIATPDGALATVIYVGFLLWVLRALVLILRRQTRDAVTSLIAGISLLDALFIVREGHVGLALVAVGACVVTRLFQRVIPGS